MGLDTCLISCDAPRRVVNMTTGRITHAEAVRVVESAARLWFDAHRDQGDAA
jgi:hypothetical protein